MAVARVNMQVGGIANVRNACRSVKEVVSNMEQSASKEAARSAAARDKLQAKLAHERIKSEERVSKEFLRLAGVEAKAAAMLSREKIRLADKTARERVKAEEKANREIQRSATQTAKYLQDVRHRSAQQAGRDAAKAASDASREASTRARALGGEKRGLFGAAGRGLGAVAGTALRLGGTVAALGGGFAAVDVVRNQMSNEAAAIALSNSAYQPGDKKRFSSRKLLESASRVQGDTGVDKGEILRGLQSYVALSGNADILNDEGSVSLFAKMAKGSGADTGDIFNSAAALKSQNSGLSTAQQAEMLRNVIGQGKLGAVELPELARVAGRVASGATAYATSDTNTQGDNQRKLLALTQIARKTSGSADDAATAVSRFSTDVATKAESNNMVADVFADAHRDKSGKMVGSKLKDPAELMEAYFLKANGNTVAMGTGGLGLGVESAKLASALSGTYVDAQKAALAGGKSEKEANVIGAAAVRKEVEKYEGAKYTDKDVEDDFQAVMKSSTERMSAAMQKINAVLEDKAAPFIEKLAGAFERNAPKIEKFLNSAEFDRLLESVKSLVSFFAEHPFAGLAGIVGASMTKEIAAARVPEILKRLLTPAAAGGGVNGPMAPVGKLGAGVDKAMMGVAAIGLGASAGMYLGGLVNEGADAAEVAGLEGADASAARSAQIARLYKKMEKGGSVSTSDASMLATSKNYAVQEQSDAQKEMDRLNRGDLTLRERAADALRSDGNTSIADLEEKRKAAVKTRLDAAANLNQQLSNVDAKTGGLVTKMTAGDLVNLEEVSKAFTATLTKAIKAATDTAPTDPNAPGRNVPQNGRPPK